jgi:hypothetical protein
MKLHQDLGFFLLLAAGVLIFTYAASPASWYIYPLLLALTGIVLYVTRTGKDRAFYILCAGQPLVIALSAVLIGAGLFAVWMLAGIVLAELGMLASGNDWLMYAAFCGITLVIAVGIQVSNHVLLPLMILTGLIALFAAVRILRDYQFRKQYTSGANP